MAASISQLTLRDLLDVGFHYGHQTKRWNPKMKPYIFEKRNGIHIIDITQSLDKIEEALAFVKLLAENGRKILFVATKKQAQEVVEKAAKESDSFYVTNRWLGGTLTNAQTIRKSIRRMRDLEKLEEENGGVFSPHKKENATLSRECAKLKKNLSGIAKMEQLPAAVFVVDIVREKNAVAEATRLGIPVIAIVDTNADPDPIQYAIPGNDDSIRSIKLIADQIAGVIKEGNESWERSAQEQNRKSETENTTRRTARSFGEEKGDAAPAEKPRTRRAPRTRTAKSADGAAAKPIVKETASESRRAAAKAAAEKIKAKAAVKKPAKKAAAKAAEAPSA